MTDLAAATDFMAGHARTLDRRRFDVLLGNDEPGRIVDAVAAYANADGGYGRGLEPDLRSPDSQPGGALHAFEAWADAAPAAAPAAKALCDWLASVSLAGGALPFALPLRVAAGSAPFWVHADHDAPSRQITAIVVAAAHRAARHDPVIARHPWLEAATDWCVAQVEALEGPPPPMALAFAVQALDAARAEAAVERLRAFVPADGLLHVAGGAADEYMRPLDFAPFPGGPARSLFGEARMARARDRERGRAAARQRPAVRAAGGRRRRRRPSVDLAVVL
jgi:hypothetical protein